MPKKRTPAKKPPQAPLKSAQLDLFSQFVANDQSEVSNTVEVWESIPKYFFTPKQTEKLRTVDGLAKPYQWEYEYNGMACAVKIQPALIEQEDGTYKAFFPNVTEELVEEALKKILTMQNYGMHDASNAETWVRFSLSLVQRELKLRGRTRSRNEIKHAIEVMSSCILTLYKQGKEVWKGPILQDLVTVGREDYLADTDAQHIARLPLFISHSINQLEYRQFNYDRMMGCNEQLSRWIYKQLIHRFRQASLTNDYHFMYSTLVRNSGLLQQSREIDNRRKVKLALDELVNHKVLMSYTEDQRKAGRKIIDVKYTVQPTSEFITEQKAANKREKMAQTHAIENKIHDR
ncbi:MAG: hypothetical protein NMNS01_11850 [Nitrosomonas sp.]|nr:MAG: hypothetical protein NMNS01_11850 [Nitrosomonas sp.]